MAKTGVLVIGSNGHNLAEKCIDWGEDAYIGDYTFVIVNTVSLNKNILKKITEQSSDYFKNLRDQIVEVQTKRGLRLICITDKVIALDDSVTSDIKNLFREGKNKINNYSWCPVIPIFEETPGEKINRKNIKLKSKYVNLIKGWERLYLFQVDNTDIKFEKDDGRYFKAHPQYLITNEIDRAVAFELYWKVHKYYDYNIEIDSNGPILFLPKVDEVKRGIDLLLEDYCKEEEVAPRWVGDIHLPGEVEKLQLMKDIEEKIKTLEDHRDKIKLEFEGINEYKKLLYAKGEELEDIVEKSFKLFDIELKKFEAGYKEDRIFAEEDAKIPFEIRGKNAGLNETDLNQLTSRFADKPVSKKYKTRGVFVLNHFRQLKPEERKEAFHHNIIEKAKSWGVCLITTGTLFELVKTKLETEVLNRLKERLLNTIGTFSTSDINHPTR